MMNAQVSCHSPEGEAVAQYMILLPDNEAAWEALGDDERNSIYSRHDEFTRLLGASGATIIHAAELAPSRTAKTVHRSADGVVITDGPYTQSAEPITGYYLVEAEDLDGLLDACSLLAGTSPVEVRALMGTDAG